MCDRFNCNCALIINPLVLKERINMYNLSSFNALICIFNPLVPEEEQTGEVYVPAKLPTLNPEQLQSLSMAKKYCQDVTSKYVRSMAVVHVQYM